MKSNNKVKALLFWAAWDKDFFKKTNDFINEARALRMEYDTIDVETREGVRMSIKYGIRNVPAIVLFKNDKVVGVERGNEGYKNLKNYL